jgi:biopolymer transport protein ExbB
MSSILIAAGWPIWPLFIISVLGLAILLERLWFLRRSKVSPEASLELALSLSKKLNTGALTDSEIGDLATNSPLGSILAPGLVSKQTGLSEFEALDRLRDAANPVFLSTDKYLGALATIATIAPLMGLFGTVVGMIEIFGSQSGAVGSPQQLAQGISIALYNTAFGLMIAIPALAGWRGLRAMADARQQECNDASRRLLKHLYPSN